MNIKYILETNRLILREVCGNDVQNLLLLFEDPDVMRFYSKRGRAEALDWIKQSQANYEKYGHSKWIIEIKESREFIGYCGLLVLNIDGAREIELGYMLKRSAWGLALATEASRACLQLAFDKFNYH